MLHMLEEAHTFVGVGGLLVRTPNMVAWGRVANSDANANDARQRA